MACADDPQQPLYVDLYAIAYPDDDLPVNRLIILYRFEKLLLQLA